MVIHRRAGGHGQVEAGLYVISIARIDPLLYLLSCLVLWMLIRPVEVRSDGLIVRLLG